MSLIGETGIFGISGQIVLHRLLTGVTPVAAWQTDIGLAANRQSWTDATGNGNTLAEATNPPTIGGALNGFSFLSFDGVAQQLTNGAINLPAPGTTPVWIAGVLRQDGYTTGRYIFTSPTAPACSVRQSGTTPALIAANFTAVNSNTGAAVGSWVYFEAYFNNNTTDYLLCGSSFVTGANAGNRDGTAGFFVASSSGANFGNISLLALVIATGGLPPQRSTRAGGDGTLPTAVLAKYGATVGT
jgi:hypothetical protein